VTKKLPTLSPVPNPSGGLRSQRINSLLDGMRSSSRYLEIGLNTGITFENVTAKRRWGVDPVVGFNQDKLPPGSRIFEQTSDSFFLSLPAGETFDFIYLDGLHQFEQALRDIENALAHLAPRGLILIDDVLPTSLLSCFRSQRMSNLAQKLLGDYSGRWHGDVYRAFAYLRNHLPHLAFTTCMEDPSGRPIHAQTILWVDVPDKTGVFAGGWWTRSRYRFFLPWFIFNRNKTKDMYRGMTDHSAIAQSLLKSQGS